MMLMTFFGFGSKKIVFLESVRLDEAKVISPIQLEDIDKILDFIISFDFFQPKIMTLMTVFLVLFQKTIVSLESICSDKAILSLTVERYRLGLISENQDETRPRPGSISCASRFPTNVAV